MADAEHRSANVPYGRILRLDGVMWGIATGFVAGFGVFVATNWLVLKGGDPVGPNLALLGQYLLGYTVTFTGSIVGFAWGFGYGCVAGYLVSTIYNWLAAHRERLGLRIR